MCKLVTFQLFLEIFFPTVALILGVENNVNVSLENFATINTAMLKL